MFTLHYDKQVNNQNQTSRLDHSLTTVSPDILPNEMPELGTPSSNSNYFYGDAITLKPIKADLAKTQTTNFIAKYTWDLHAKIIKTWNDSEIGSEIPAAELGSFFMCDGQPANQMMRTIAAGNFSDKPEDPHWINTYLIKNI